jgi:hypothetical protein
MRGSDGEEKKTILKGRGVEGGGGHVFQTSISGRKHRGGE